MKLHYEFMEFTKEENEKIKILNSKYEQKIKDLSLVVKKQEDEILNLKKNLIKKEECFKDLEMKLKHHEDIVKTARNSAPDFNSNLASISSDKVKKH
jgi:hypothetical protein